MVRFHVIVWCLAVSPFAVASSAEEETQTWTDGPSLLDLNYGTLSIPKGFRYVQNEAANEVLTARAETYGSVLACLEPSDQSWYVVVYYSDVGFIEDPKWVPLKKSSHLVVHGAYDGEDHRFDCTSTAPGAAYEKASFLGRRGVLSFVRSNREKSALDPGEPRFKELLEGFSFGAGERYEDAIAEDLRAMINLDDLFKRVRWVDDSQSSGSGWKVHFAFAFVILLAGIVKVWRRRRDPEPNRDPELNLDPEAKRE